MSLELALNGVLAVLLVAVIVYAALLNRRLGNWREGRAELARASSEFVKAAERAEAALAELRAASEASGRLLEDQTRKALSLRDDLEVLMSRAEPAADRLMEAVRPARPAVAPAPVPAPAPRAVAPLRAAEPPADRAPPRSTAEQDLLRAIAERRKGTALQPAGARA
jgi:hypothetical protein